MAGAVQVFHDNALERNKLNREARLLSELNEWLQSCKSLDELYQMVGEFLSRAAAGLRRQPLHLCQLARRAGGRARVERRRSRRRPSSPTTAGDCGADAPTPSARAKSTSPAPTSARPTRPTTAASRSWRTARPSACCTWSSCRADCSMASCSKEAGIAEQRRLGPRLRRADQPGDRQRQAARPAARSVDPRCADRHVQPALHAGDLPPRILESRAGWASPSASCRSTSTTSRSSTTITATTPATRSCARSAIC